MIHYNSFQSKEFFSNKFSGGFHHCFDKIKFPVKDIVKNGLIPCVFNTWEEGEALKAAANNFIIQYPHTLKIIGWEYPEFNNEIIQLLLVEDLSGCRWRFCSYIDKSVVEADYSTFDIEWDSRKYGGNEGSVVSSLKYHIQYIDMVKSSASARPVLY